MKLLDIVLALLLIPCAIVAQDKKSNYITTRRVIADGDTLTTIEYFDGLGRSSEVVQKGFSGGGFMDLVSLTEYDGMGCEVRKWNPAPIGTTGGYITPVVFREEARNFSDDWSPYSEYEYDKTFDNRVTKELGPGDAWHVKGKARELEYGGIATMKYPVFTLSSDKKTFTFKRYFCMYDLSMVRVTDEDGLTATKYYNVLNQPVIEEKGDSAVTYYIYDTSGNLVYVLPPAAYASCLVRGEVHSINTDDCLQKYAYFYRYDGKNRCIEKKLPGCEPVKMMYDKSNRMIFRQDGNLRKTGEWQFMLYDSYGRPTVRGVCKNADKIGIANMQVESRFSTTGEYGMYNANISLDVSYLLKVNYYGHYAFLGNSSSYHYQIQDGYDKDIYNDGNKVTEWGLLTGCRTYLLRRYRLQTAKDGLLESLYYNNEGEVVQVHKDNSTGGIDDIYYHRNPYTGSVLQEKWVHRSDPLKMKNANEATETIIRRYTYDGNGRLDSVLYQFNDNDEFLVKHYEYDDVGRVGKTTSHSDALSTSYSYNVRGQQTSVTNKLTDQHVYYNQPYPNGQNTLAYNGNVSAFEWKSKKDGEWKTESYSYEYDTENRLSSAYSMSLDNSGDISLGKHDTHYEYDSMGNITGIVRKGVNYDDGEEGYRDNATLEYDGNQLVHVSNDGFKDSSRDTQISDREYDNIAEFGYDANGNMTRNLNKGILKVTYNVLNLPESIYMRSNQYVYNVYDGDGNKLSSERHTCKYNITVPESGTIQGNLDTLRVKSGLLSMDYPEMTVYDGDFVYRTELVDMSKPSLEGLDTYALGSKYSNKLVLSRINFEDGYVVPRKSKFQVYDYVKDYLGNVRFVETNNRVIEVNNYYPFGGFYGDDDNVLGQNWKFGNKEFQRMFGEYDFGGRWLDPTEGRFNSMDKYAEKYYCSSPYIYCKANPIANIDPSGNYILPSLFISNDQRYSIPYRSLKKFINAMVDFGKTTFGKKILADFLPVGYKQYGVSGNGKFADCGLHFIEDNTCNNAKMINGKLYYKESQGTMEVKVYVDCRNMSQAQILETVVHELTLHGYDIEERLNDYKNKKKSNRLKITENEEHADLLNKTNKLGGGLYMETWRQLDKINPSYSTAFEERLDELRNPQK